MDTEKQNQLYSRYNTDDVFDRVVIIGLLNLLNHKIWYEQIWQDNVVEKVEVPFMYDFGSSEERFAQDNYTFFGEGCFINKKITGKFDMLPRGVLKYTGCTIDSANITNRFVRGTYLKNENGVLTSYSSFLYSIPLSYSFDVEMFIDNILSAFKIQEALRNTFYKNKTFYVMYRGMKIGCTAGFPEQTSMEKTISYSFDTERQIKLTFNIAVETYQPSFDHSMDIESDKRIEHIGFDVEMPKENVEKIRSIRFVNLGDNVVIPAGCDYLLEWDSRSNVSDMCTVKLSYIDAAGNEHIIGEEGYNQHSYLWHVPPELSEFNEPTVVFNDPNIIVNEPTVKVIPNAEGIIGETSFVIVDPGLFNVPDEDTMVAATIEYTLPDGTIDISDAYMFNIHNRVIDMENPVTIKGEPMRYKCDVNFTHITLKISYPLDETVSDEKVKVQII